MLSRVRNPLASRRPGLSFRPFGRRLLTLAVEGFSLRLVTFHGTRVERATSIPFNPRFVRGGAVVDSAGLGQVIQTVLANERLRRGRVSCSFPGQHVAYRILTLPAVSAREMENVVAREARRVLAYAPEASYLFWKELPSPAPRSARIFVVVVPRAALRTLLETLEQAGLRPELVELKPLALAKAVNKENAIIANLENTSLDLVIVQDYLPAMLRSVALGDEVLAPELAAARLGEELQRTLTFYNDTNRERPLNPELPIYLTGDLTVHPQVAATVTAVTGRPTPPLEPPFQYSAELPPVASYMVNLGLALESR